jgi:hypothetical protein
MLKEELPTFAWARARDAEALRGATDAVEIARDRHHRLLANPTAAAALAVQPLAESP